MITVITSLTDTTLLGVCLKIELTFKNIGSPTLRREKSFHVDEWFNTGVCKHVKVIDLPGSS